MRHKPPVCGTAVIFGGFRFQLWRGMTEYHDAQKAAAWVCANPSTADGEVNDPSILRMWGFTREWGYESMTVFNVNPVRATNPRDAFIPDEDTMEMNDNWLTLVQSAHAVTICGWGDVADIGLVKRAVRLMHKMGPLHALRVNASGMPAHPLYLPGSLRPQIYKPTWMLN